MTIRLLDERAGREIHPLAVALLYEDRFGLLPELYEIFGEESLIKFLDIFAGRTLQVPDRDLLERRIRNVRIWVEVENGRNVAELASEIGMQPASVHQIAKDMRGVMDQFKIRAQGGVREPEA